MDWKVILPQQVTKVISGNASPEFPDRIQNLDEWMEELERNPEMIDKKSHILYQLPEMFNYHDASLNHDDTEVRKVKGKYKYFVWRNQEGLAWWDLEDQVNTSIITFMY